MLLDNEITRKWIEELPKRKQAHGKLRDNDTFCCLGVYCDIVDSSKWGENLQDDVYSYAAHSYFAPSYIAEQIGMTQEIQDHFYLCNDFLELTLEQIASIVQRMLRYPQENPLEAAFKLKLGTLDTWKKRAIQREGT